MDEINARTQINDREQLNGSLSANEGMSASLMMNRTYEVPTNLGDLGDVTLNSPAQGEVLKYNGTKWVNAEDGGISDYMELTNKPKINNVELTGNKTTEDLGLFSGDYDDLENKPSLFSGDYNDLLNKPTIPEEYITSVSDEFSVSDAKKLSLSNNITKRLATIDQNITDGFLKGNIWNEQWKVGSIDVSKGGVVVESSDRIVPANYIDVKPNTTYFIASDKNVRIVEYTADKTMNSYSEFIANTTYTTHTNTAYILFYAVNYGTVYKNDIAIIEGTSGSYVPYSKSNVELTRAIDISADYLQGNIWNEKWESGSLSTSGVPTVNANQIRSAEFIPCKGSTTYYLVGSVQIFEYSSASSDGYLDRNFHTNEAFTTKANTKYLKFRSADGVTTYNHDIAIIEGNSGSYQPYAKSNVELTSTLDNLTEEIATLVKAKIITYESHTFANGTSVYTPSALPSGVPTSGTIVGILFGGSITFDNMYIQWNGGESQSVNSVNTYRCNVNNMRGSSVTTQLKATVFYI